MFLSLSLSRLYAQCFTLSAISFISNALKNSSYYEKWNYEIFETPLYLFQARNFIPQEIRKRKLLRCNTSIKNLVSGFQLIVPLCRITDEDHNGDEGGDDKLWNSEFLIYYELPCPKPEALSLNKLGRRRDRGVTPR